MTAPRPHVAFCSTLNAFVPVASGVPTGGGPRPPARQDGKLGGGRSDERAPAVPFNLNACLLANDGWPVNLGDGE